MKNVLNDSIKLFYFVTLFSFTLSCTEEESNDFTSEETNTYENVDPDDPIVKVLVDKGWNIDKIHKLSNGNYLIGKDMLLSGNIEDYENVGTNKQIRSGKLVDDYRDIRVFLHSSATQEDPANTNAPNEDNWADAVKML